MNGFADFISHASMVTTLRFEELRSICNSMTVERCLTRNNRSPSNDGPEAFEFTDDVLEGLELLRPRRTLMFRNVGKPLRICNQK